MPRLPSLLDPPVAFACGDDPALALRLGATGVAVPVWITADGVPVVTGTGTVRRGVRRRPLLEVTAAELPEDVHRLDATMAICAPAAHLCLDIADFRAVPEAIAMARDHGDLEERLWLRHSSLADLQSWRDLTRSARLVHAARLDRLPRGPEAHVAELRRLGVDALELHESEWSGGTIALVHRFGLLAVGGDAQHERMLDGLLDAGIDALRGDHADRLADALARAGH